MMPPGVASLLVAAVVLLASLAEAQFVTERDVPLGALLLARADSAVLPWPAPPGRKKGEKGEAKAAHHRLLHHRLHARRIRDDVPGRVPPAARRHVHHLPGGHQHAGQPALRAVPLGLLLERRRLQALHAVPAGPDIRHRRDGLHQLRRGHVPAHAGRRCVPDLPSRCADS